MILSDRQLKQFGPIMVDPFDVDRVQSNSIDLTLGNTAYRQVASSHPIRLLPDGTGVDLAARFWNRADAWERKEFDSEHGLILNPGDFVLGHTFEAVTLPGELVGNGGCVTTQVVADGTHACVDNLRPMRGFVHGRSKYGRLGLLVHVTAGMIDCGFSGQITLELGNLGNRPLILTPGMAICSLELGHLTSWPERPYGPERGSTFKGQMGPRPPWELHGGL